MKTRILMIILFTFAFVATTSTYAAALPLPFAKKDCRGLAKAALTTKSRAFDAHFFYERDSRFYNENPDLKRLAELAGKLPSAPDPALTIRAAELEKKAIQVCEEERRAMIQKTVKKYAMEKAATQRSNVTICRTRTVADGLILDDMCRELGIPAMDPRK